MYAVSELESPAASVGDENGEAVVQVVDHAGCTYAVTPSVGVVAPVG